MAISIKNPEAERLARELAKRTGESMTEAIVKALRERLQHVTGRRRVVSLAEQIGEIATRCSVLPLLDVRSEEEILGYDEKGLPR